MKNEIEITVSLNGNEVTRKYIFGDVQDIEPMMWAVAVTDMLDTLSKSNEPIPEIPGFEGTRAQLDALTIRK